MASGASVLGLSEVTMAMSEYWQAIFPMGAPLGCVPVPAAAEHGDQACRCPFGQGGKDGRQGIGGVGVVHKICGGSGLSAVFPGGRAPLSTLVIPWTIAAGEMPRLRAAPAAHRIFSRLNLPVSAEVMAIVSPLICRSQQRPCDLVSDPAGMDLGRALDGYRNLWGLKGFIQPASVWVVPG